MSSIVKRVQITQKRCSSAARNLAQKRFRKLNRMSDLRAMRFPQKECLFSQCFPKKTDITSTHFLQSILFHPDGLLIEAVTDREMFWLELAPAGWARFDKVA